MNGSEYDWTQESYRRRVLALSFVGLAVLMAWQALTVRFYEKREKRPPAWDQAIHLEIALDYRNAIQQGRLADAWHLQPKPGMPAFPPLYHLGLYWVHGTDNPAGMALWLNWFYMAVLCLSLFAICWHFRPDETALAATIAFAASPGLQELLTTQLVDLAVVACSAAAFWMLLKCDDFKSWGWSLGFGLAFAVGMLHKWSFFSYMIPAYLVGLRALSQARSRWKALASLGLSLVLFGPWYWSHFPLLLPRLIQASADFAVPVWKGGAFFTYLLASADAFGPPLWLLAWIALAVPVWRLHWEQGWLVLVWTLASYVFWAIVPNRQMRFLLPGLSGMAAVFAGAWPAALVWSVAAYQVLAALNYAGGWMAPLKLPLPYKELVFLESAPPRADDWKLSDILRRAQELHRPEFLVANLVLVANDRYFNGPGFVWTQKRLGLKDVRLRGVNRRLCEFAEFVLLKTGSLGPPGVIEGLPAAAGVIQDKASWFSLAYAPAAEWPLPDGSKAVLYQQKRLSAAPFRGSSVRFQFYENGALKAEDLKVELGPWDAVQGVYSRVKVTAKSISLRGLVLTRAALELEGAALVPAGAVRSANVSDWEDVRFLRLRRLTVRSAEVSAADLGRFLEERVKGLKIARLELDKTLRVEGSFGAFAAAGEVEIVRDEAKRLKFTVKDARLGVTPLPASVLNRIKELTVSLDPNPETPFAIDFPGLTVKNGKLTIP